MPHEHDPEQQLQRQSGAPVSGVRDVRRLQFSMQVQAGRWLREFDELLQKNPKPGLADYLGENGGITRWNGILECKSVI